MGACGSANNKQKTVKSNQKKENQKPNQNQIKIEQSQKPIENTQTKLKASPPVKKNENIEEPKLEKKKIKISIKNNEDNEDLLNSSFDENTLLKDIFSKIKYDKNRDYDILDENMQKLNNKLDLKLKEIFSNNNSDINLKIKYSGIDIPENIIEAYSQNINLIGALKLNNQEYFGIFILNTITNISSTFYYSNEVGNELSKFTPFSAICNGKNSLFISGGENQNNNNELLNDFYMIDLTKIDENTVVTQKLPNLIEARTWHSMIFIPNSYIFIVGGNGNKKVELYNIQENIINIDSELNDERCECSLCMVNNIYLYAFCGFLLHQTFNNTIERCNLRREKRKWEIVNYTLENNIQFNPSFFGVGYCNDKILLLGGNENPEEKNKNYIITLSQNGDDVINEFNLNKEIISVYREKFFIPISQTKSVNIPLIFNQPEVLYLNINDGIIESKEFEGNNN